ncbi:TerD family protein [Epilithonimonas ginsengisoli]|uniref:TerD family protein n=1 Tax=Epilithonimonas ginsengisoli TaxID=1245592 RepID=A0ABU4JJ17_9FLAO|nr:MULTISPECIES: TerD family protein [Chryseobacterium group]MBV6880228.1 TerD family protein [Epilithonimonas sp. FP105]MDW8549680.1 TerD family protein [Epilithonimonas ginsengisoli]OAH72238.1 chemical-damaging agent resistance protein C [Chryseobacterium sp. FP211-J200]
MAINLQKGQKIDIGLTKMTIGLGWDPNEGTGHDFDLDASAIMIDSNRKLVGEDYFIFYNNLKSPDDALTHTGDDPTGGNSDGDDDEAIIIDLEKVDPRVEEILFVVTIEDFERRKQNFGQVRNSYIRIVDNSNNEEIAKYELDEDFSIETGVEFGRLYKRNGAWKFEASGIGYKADLGFFLEKYYNGSIIK